MNFTQTSSQRIHIPEVSDPIDHALKSLQEISRTFGGVSDTSTSDQKSKLALTGPALAEQINTNFDSSVRHIIRHLKVLYAPKDVFDLLVRTNENVNETLKTDGFEMWRKWPTKHHIPPEQIQDSLNKFCKDFLEQRQSKKYDPINFAAWIEKTLNAHIHPFYDGCGRVSRALSVAVLAEAGFKYPSFKSRDEYFQLIEQPMDQWLDSYRAKINNNPKDHEYFLEQLKSLDLSDSLREQIDFAYTFAKNAHRGDDRESEKSASGKPIRYFEHPKSVALVLIQECREELIKLPKESQAVLIIAALLHDVPEDTYTLGGRRILAHGNDWREIAKVRITRSFDPNNDGKLASIVLAVTKPTDSELLHAGINSDSIGEIKSFTANLVKEGGTAAGVIKWADRLSNLRTMARMRPEKVLSKIQETQKYFTPVIEQLIDSQDEYAPLLNLLDEKINDQITELHNRSDIAQYLEGTFYGVRPNLNPPLDSEIDSLFKKEKEEFLSLLPEEWKELGYTEWIDSIFSFSEAAFQGQFRDGGIDELGRRKRSFSHTIEVAKQFLENCREEFLKLPRSTACTLLAAALLHDVGEDTGAYNLLESDRAAHHREQLEQSVMTLFLFGPFTDEEAFEAASIINGVTKCSNKEISQLSGFKDKSHPQWIQIKNLLQDAFLDLGGPASVAIKCADKLSNMNLEGLDRKRKEKMLAETIEYTLQFFESYCAESKGGIFTTLITSLTEQLNSKIKKAQASLNN